MCESFLCFWKQSMSGFRMNEKNMSEKDKPRNNIENKMKEAVNFLYDIPKFTTKNSPQHTKDFLVLLGNPQDSFKTIHVAGSNGKGSVCKFMNEMLIRTGKSVGLFTSPHLVDIRERFLINGQMCSEEAFLDAYMQVKSAAEQQQAASGAYPTFFEFIFAMGMVLFREANLEYVVLETGLGGRLDATNTVTAPLLTIITSISLEHTEYLGDTIALVAGEKAGIMKPGAPVVFDANEPEATEVIKARARELGVPFYGVEKNMCRILEIKRNLIDFSLTTQYDKKTNWRIPFTAFYQVMNASLAITGMRVLQEMELRSEAAGSTEAGVSTDSEAGVSTNSVADASMNSVTDADLYQAIAHTHWQGRMEEVLPNVFLDGAHNVAGITEFVKNVNLLLQNIRESAGEDCGFEKTDADVSPKVNASGKKPILLFSMVKEKDYVKAIRLLAESVDWAQVFVATIPNQRGIPSEELQHIFKSENGLIVESVPDHRQALDKVLELQQTGQMVFCTGSLYFIGALKEELR